MSHISTGPWGTYSVSETLNQTINTTSNEVSSITSSASTSTSSILDFGDLGKLLSGLGVSEVLSHAAVLTVAEWTPVLPSHVLPTKSLALKDKKDQIYLLVASGTTEFDLKLVTKILGLPSGSVRFLAADLLESILKVKQGSG